LRFECCWNYFTDTKELSGRQSDPFFDIVTRIMKKIENRMRESPYAVQLISDEPNRLQAPPDHGSDRYTQWINALEKPVARIPEQDFRRFFVACQRHLEVSNNAYYLDTCCKCSLHGQSWRIINNFYKLYLL